MMVLRRGTYLVTRLGSVRQPDFSPTMLRSDSCLGESVTSSAQKKCLFRYFSSGPDKHPTSSKKRAGSLKSILRPAPIDPNTGKVKICGKTADGLKIVPAFLVYGSKNEGAKCDGCGGMITKNRNVLNADGIMGTAFATSLTNSRRLKTQSFLRYNKVLCERCASLNKLSSDTGTADIEKLSVVQTNSVSAAIFAADVAKIKNKNAWAVHVVDATDFDSTIMRNVREIVGSNPLVIAVTKTDLLPVDNTDEKAMFRLKKYFLERCKTKGLRCHELFMLSGLNNNGVDAVVKFVLDQLNGKDVYIFGYANTGKSTLVNAFVNETLRHQLFMKGSRGKQRKDLLSDVQVTSSNLPGTTLLSIRIPCFSSYKHALWDTPGIFSKRFKWIQDARPIKAEGPQMIVPKVLEGHISVDSIDFFVAGIPLRVEMIRRGKKSGRRVVWYSNEDVTPETAVHTDPPVSAEAQLVSDAASLPLFKSFAPAQDSRYEDTFAADIVFFDLGWLALSFDAPHDIKIYIPKAAMVAIRPVLFHPLSVSAQLKYIKELEKKEIAAPVPIPIEQKNSAAQTKRKIVYIRNPISRHSK